MNPLRVRLDVAVPPLESALFPPVARHFRDLGYAIQAEVDVNGRIADVLALGPDGLVAVELKLTDWKGALRQAVAYQVGVERSYVGLPLDTAMTVIRKRSAYEAEGVGLLAVHPPDGSGEEAWERLRAAPDAAASGCVRELIPARPSPRHLPFMADRLRAGFVRLA